MLGIVYRCIATHLVKKAGFPCRTAQTGAVTLIQRFGSALNLNIHFHPLFLDGVQEVDPENGTASCSTDAIRTLFPDNYRPSLVPAFSCTTQATMPSADFCKAVTVNCFTVSHSFDTLQTSRGKALGFRCVDAEFIKRSPLADGRLRGHVPTRLSYVTPRIQFLSVAPQFALSFLQTPPHDNALA